MACVASTTASADVGVCGHTPLAADSLCKSGGKDLPAAATTDPIDLASCVAACTEFEEFECAAFVFNDQTCRLHSVTLPLTWSIQNNNRFLIHDWMLNQNLASETHDSTDVVDSVNPSHGVKCCFKDSPPPTTTLAVAPAPGAAPVPPPPPPPPAPVLQATLAPGTQSSSGLTPAQIAFIATGGTALLAGTMAHAKWPCIKARGAVSMGPFTAID